MGAHMKGRDDACLVLGETELVCEARHEAPRRAGAPLLPGKKFS